VDTKNSVKILPKYFQHFFSLHVDFWKFRNY